MLIFWAHLRLLTKKPTLSSHYYFVGVKTFIKIPLPLMWSPWHGFWMTSVLGKDWILQINNTEGSMQSNMAYSVASHWFVLNLNREGALAAGADELLWVSMTNAIHQHQTSLQMDSILSVYRLHNGEGEKQNARHLISFFFLRLIFYYFKLCVCSWEGKGMSVQCQ